MLLVQKLARKGGFRSFAASASQPCRDIGSRHSGDDYQDIVALEVLVEMLAEPQVYEWVKLEADDAGALDDVVVLKRDGTIVAKQVKFSALGRR